MTIKQKYIVLYTHAHSDDVIIVDQLFSGDDPVALHHVDLVCHAQLVVVVVVVDV